MKSAKIGDKPTKTWLQLLGPGLITGASDDDPSGIATYSQAGAGFGFGLLWTKLFSYPLMCAVQQISGRIGRVTGHGIAGNIRRYYPAWLLYPLVVLLVLANTFNIGGHWRHGRGAETSRRRKRRALCRHVRRIVLTPANSGSIFEIFRLFEMAYTCVVQLCGDSFAARSPPALVRPG